MKNEFSFDLSTPINYHSEGQQKPAKKLTFCAPSNKHRKQCLTIKNDFMNIIKSIKSDGKSEKEDSGKISSRDFVNVFLTSSDQVHSSFDAFEEMMISGICKVDVNEDMTRLLVEQMSIDDFEGCFGEYCKIFLLSSLTS